MIARTPLWLSMLWGGLFAFSVARAEPPPRVYVTARASTPELSPLARDIAALARAALSESEGFDWQAPERLVRGDVQAAQEALVRARSALKRGRQAYLGFELDAAVPALESALAELVQAGAVLDSPEPIAETLMYLGACHVLSGERAKAAETFARYHATVPEIAPDARVFNPEIMAAWEASGREVKKAAKGRLVVQVSGDEAEISLDGRVRGTGALSFENLAPGEHWVRVSVLGGSGFFAVAKVAPRSTTTVDAGTRMGSAELPGLFAALADAQGGKALARALDVRALGVIEVGPGSAPGELTLGLRAFDSAGELAIEPIERRAGPSVLERARTVRGMVAAWLDAVVKASHARRLPVAVSAPVEKEPAPLSSPATARNDQALERPWYKRWWVWTLAGGALAATAATVAIVASKDDKSEPTNTRTPGTGTLVLQF